MRRLATRERGYMPQLDGLRFFAVMGVIVVHNWQPSSDVPVLGQLDWGDLGVRLFFVLSGFLITGILLAGRELEREPGRRLHFIRQFYVRRFLRIFPVYYAVLLVLIAAGVGQMREVWPWLFTYTTNIYTWHHLAFPYAVPHFWTLAVEEQFYLVWPWLLIFLPRRWIVPFLAGVCCVGPAWRLWASFHYARADWDAAYTFTLGVVDFLALGALLAVLGRREGSEAWLRRALHYAAATGVVAYASLEWLSRHGDHHVSIAVRNTGAGLVFCWLIEGASRGFGGVFGRILGWGPIVYLGKISYGIYIYHLLVPLAFARVAPHLGVDYTNSGFVNFLATSVVTFAVAAFSWHGFERPLNGLKSRFRYLEPAPAMVEEALVAATP